MWSAQPATARKRWRCAAAAPDIVLTDIEMPQMTGLELARAGCTSGLPAKVVIVTTFARSGYLRRAWRPACAATC
jgi:YesN/AraC family two-component response regulator